MRFTLNIERADHHGRDGEVSDDCRQNGKVGNNEYESSNSSQKLTIEAQLSVSSVTSSNDYSSNDEYSRDYNPNMPGIQNMYRAY